MPKDTFYKEWPTGHGTNGEYPAREGEVAKIIDAYITSFPNCEIRFECPMRNLILEDGKVVGAYAEGKDGMIRINATKGVIVATGGYAYNQENVSGTAAYPLFLPGHARCLPLLHRRWHQGAAMGWCSDGPGSHLPHLQPMPAHSGAGNRAPLRSGWRFLRLFLLCLPTIFAGRYPTAPASITKVPPTTT